MAVEPGEPVTPGTKPQLRRSIGLWGLSLYGIGTIVGAGIYVLVGKVSAYAGALTPLAFMLAAIIAGFSAASYAELSSRFPKAGGVAVYVAEAFRQRWLTTGIGLAIVVMASLSAGALTLGFAGYLRIFIDLPDLYAVPLILGLFLLVALWGIELSMTVIIVATILEIGGLLLVVFASGPALLDMSNHLPDMLSVSPVTATGLLLGAFLAFYALIGFEDMVNLAEEVHTPQRLLPWAIFIAVGATTILYVLTSLSAVAMLSPDLLAASDAPLADILHQAGYGKTVIGLISLLAVSNGALIQIIMGARLLYGMARDGHLPQQLAYVHPTRQTPVVTTVIVVALILTAAMALPVVSLAELASLLTLATFALVNVAVIVLRRQAGASEGGLVLPLWVPAMGAALSTAMILFRLLQTIL